MTQKVSTLDRIRARVLAEEEDDKAWQCRHFHECDSYHWLCTTKYLLSYIDQLEAERDTKRN